MPPLFVLLRLPGRSGKVHTWWLPLFLVWLLLLPLALLVLAVVWLAALFVMLFAPRRAAELASIPLGVAAVFAALRGFNIEIAGSDRKDISIIIW